MNLSKIFLIGPRGSGKTTLGKALSKELDLKFLDMDELIEKRCGLKISQIVQIKGWSYFRDVESELLIDLLKESDPCVIATGGGVIIKEKNRKILRKGIVFYLKTPVQVLIERLKRDSSHIRPSLTELPLEEEVMVVLREREKLYKNTAHFVLDGSKNISNLVKDAKKLLSHRLKQSQKPSKKP